MKALIIIFIFIVNGSFICFHPQKEDSARIAPDESFNFSMHKHYSVSRFMKIFTSNGIDNYSSPSAVFSIENLPFNLFPLNLHSSDLMPISKSNYFTSETGNNINYYEQDIPEYLRAELQMYVGSETGDPLIHLYTKPNDPGTNSNINKIVPSGLFTISNKINNNYYKFSAGYYGYFITGAKNDKIIQRLNQYYSLKQNKQIYTGLSFIHEYHKNKSLILYSDFISYYGWDIPPFIGEYVHFENYALSSKLIYANNEEFSLALKNDLVLNDIHNTAFFKGTRSFYTETSFLPSYKLSKDHLMLNSSGTLSYLTAANEQMAEQQKYLSKELNKLYGNIMLNAVMEAPYNLDGEFSIKYNRHYNNEDYLDYNAALKYEFRNNSSIGLRYSRNVKAPNFNELYGMFQYAYSDTSYLFPEHYYISGNENLKAEKDNTLSLSYKAANALKSFKAEADIFYKIIKDQIGKAPAGYNSYIYINYPAGEIWGGNAKAALSISKWGKIAAAYNFLDNKDFIHASKHTLFSQFVYMTNFNSEISIAAKFKSKQDWSRQFASLAPSRKVLTENTVYNIYYEQNLKDFYFFNHLIFKIEVENIFDKPCRNIPMGKNLRRAIIFYLNTSIY